MGCISELDRHSFIIYDSYLSFSQTIQSWIVGNVGNINVQKISVEKVTFLSRLELAIPGISVQWYINTGPKIHSPPWNSL